MDPANYTRTLAFITVSTFVTQFYVIYLVIHKTPASTRQYCYFLYLFAVGFSWGSSSESLKWLFVAKKSKFKFRSFLG